MRDRRGNVAVILAVLAPVLILALGGTIDVVNASMRQAQLQQSVDAAAVAAVARYSAAYKTALTMPGDGPIVTDDLPTTARSVFDANHKLSGDTTLNAFVVNAQKAGPVVSATVTATATFNASFLELIGRPSIPLSATAVAKNNMPVFINYYILVDVSQSMGIAATAADMTALYNRIPKYKNQSGGESSCVFGCHVQAPSTNAKYSGKLQPYTNEYLAHNINPKITLRIDAAVTAIQNIITQAQSAAGGAKNIKIGLYTISKDPVTNQNVNVISPPSSDYANLQTLATNIDLGNNISAGDGDSDFEDEIANFASAYLGPNGSGINTDSPINYVFLITDGFVDTTPPTDPAGAACLYSTHCVRAFNSANCDAIKGNATVGVIYTTYNPIYSNNNQSSGYETNYNALVRPYSANLAPSLQSCASSSSLYFEASDGPAINTAMTALFTSTLITARIGQ